jgi:nucleoside-diphosphate kinase
MPDCSLASLVIVLCVQDLVIEYSLGPLIAVEVTGPSAVSTLRTLAGPRDTELAKRIRPESLRARFGTSTSKPSIHVTDLEEDGSLECEYMFSLLK